jgi:hypothetical protein
LYGCQNKLCGFYSYLRWFITEISNNEYRIIGLRENGQDH